MKIKTKKPKNLFDFSNDPLQGIDVESEMAAPANTYNQHHHTGYYQGVNGHYVPNAPAVAEKKEVNLISDDDFSEDEDEKLYPADKVLMNALVSDMTPDEANRFEVYRR